MIVPIALIVGYVLRLAAVPLQLAWPIGVVVGAIVMWLFTRADNRR